jgi:uncharacterized protein
MSMKKVRNFILQSLAVLLLLVLAAWAAILVLKPGPSGKIVIASGGSEGAYNDLALLYQKQMARQGVEVELRPLTAGTATLGALFRNETSDIDGGFIKGGVSGSLQGRFASEEDRKRHDMQAGALVSVGRLFYEPIYVFYRGPDQVKGLSEFKGKKIAIGGEGGGSRRIARTLLQANGIDANNSTFVDGEMTEDAKGLITGDYDVAFLILPPDSPKIFKLMRTADILLMDFSAEADAYASRFPFLSKLVMNRGSVEFAPDIPSADITLLSTSVALVMRKSVHTSILTLLADAVLDNPRRGFDRDGEPILFHKSGEFPHVKDPEYPVDRDTLALYKSGDLPIVLRNMAPLNARLGIPYWVTALLHTHGTSMLLLLIPLLSILVPLARILPMIYAWTVRRRLLVWYRQMQRLEIQLDQSPTPAQLTEARDEVERLDISVSRIRVPIEFADQLYDLRGHIHQIRRRLQMREVSPLAAE